MNYTGERLADRLAAEYVLGTLRGPARRRFERLLEAHPVLRAHVRAWEERLGPMAARVAPVRPPRRVWRRIRRATGTSRGVAGAWRAWAMAASLLAAVLLGYFSASLLPGPPAAPSYAAVVTGGHGRALWLVTADVRRGTLSVRAVGRVPSPGRHSYQLWLLAKNAPPRSLGLLPSSGSSRHPLPRSWLAGRRGAVGIAVSLEPPGGSPTGRPTGPVLYQATLARG
ncbi:MAG TPA: anti-sigma factor [Gammaproteobacteria bacterium]|nr:anti-sigma factor [Gammaproteobacteria bacterium]